MIHQNKAWREITGFELDPTGKPLESLVSEKKLKGDKMKDTKKGELMYLRGCSSGYLALTLNISEEAADKVKQLLNEALFSETTIEKKEIK